VTESQLQTELALLFARGFRGLVTNAMTYGLEAAPRVAKRLGFHHVIAKLWWADDATLAHEKRHLAAAIADIDAIVVGNETVHKALLRGEPGDAALARLQQELDGLQRAYGKPVSTGLHRDDWARYPQIATEFGDFVFPNLQPWWVQLRNNPDTAAQWVVEALQVMRDTPGMPADRIIVIQEAAYPSAALPPASAPGATPAHQQRFVEQLIASGVPFIYGFAFDAWFARASSPPGGFGGLWDEHRQPKPVVAVLDLGPYA
jgi:exo-beta-1,3-glucanase (GH17 family)